MVKSSPLLTSLSNHSLEKFLDFKRWKKKLMNWCRIAPNGLIWSINLQNFSWRACSLTPQKGLPPSAVTIFLFNHFRSWFLIFSLFKWSVPALWYRPFTCKLCVFFQNCGYTYTSMSWRRAFLSSWWIFFTDKIWGRRRRRSMISIRFFFITIQICLSWRVAGLLIFVSPKP